MIQFGIRRLELQFYSRSRVLFHSFGDFKTSRSPAASIEPQPLSYSRLDLEYEVFDLLDIEGKPCNSGELIIRKIQTPAILFS